MYYLIKGKLLFEGQDDIPVDFTLSVSLFEKAIDSGNREALYFLGQQYRHGLGLQKDESKAVELFATGASLEDLDCLYEMAEVEKDPNKRFEYYTKAANLGHVVAKRNMGWCLEKGIGVEVEVRQALKCYKSAAEAGDKKAKVLYKKAKKKYGKIKKPKEFQESEHNNLSNSQVNCSTEVGTIEESISDAAKDAEFSSLNPIKQAFNQIRNGSLTAGEACKSVLTREACVSSIEEWYFSHRILLEAVRVGDLAGTPSFNGNLLHWWETIYFQAASFEMGEYDLNIMISLVIEAAEAGVIASGSAQDLFCAREFKKELKNNTCMLTSAIEHLLLHQIETDDRIQYLIHRQSDYESSTDERMNYLYFKQQKLDSSITNIRRKLKIQQVVTLINAVVGCVPFVGGIATHVISGGATIMTEVAGEGFAVSGLVESIFGIVKDASSIIADPIVDFLKTGKNVLATDTWDGLPEEKKKTVLKAAKELEITIEDLRKRIDVVLDPTEVQMTSCLEEGIDSKSSESPQPNDERLWWMSPSLFTCSLFLNLFLFILVAYLLYLLRWTAASTRPAALRSVINMDK